MRSRLSDHAASSIAIPIWLPRDTKRTLLHREGRGRLCVDHPGTSDEHANGMWRAKSHSTTTAACGCVGALQEPVGVEYCRGEYWTTRTQLNCNTVEARVSRNRRVDRASGRQCPTRTFNALADRCSTRVKVRSVKRIPSRDGQKRIAESLKGPWSQTKRCSWQLVCYMGHC